MVIKVTLTFVVNVNLLVLSTVSMPKQASMKTHYPAPATVLFAGSDFLVMYGARVCPSMWQYILVLSTLGLICVACVLHLFMSTQANDLLCFTIGLACVVQFELGKLL
jgi:hypothetical protein